MNKILVVDDDLDILAVVRFMLTMNNFEVETVSNWKDIDNRMLDFRPDIVLLDVSLGGADGREICKKMHISNVTKDIPVILFSANPEMGKYLEESMAQAFIPKPFELPHLVQTLRSYLN